MSTLFQFTQKQSNIFWLIAFIGVICGIFTPRTLAYTPGVLGLGFYAFALFKTRSLLPVKKTEAMLFFVFLALAYFSHYWSINPEYSVVRTMKLGCLLIPGLLLFSVCRHLCPPPQIKATKIIIRLTISTALILMYLKLTDHALIEALLQRDIAGSQLNRSYVIFALISLVSLYLVKISDYTKKIKYILCISLVALSSLSLYFCISQTAQLTYACGLFFLFLWPLASQVWGRVFFGSIIVMCLILPFVIKPALDLIPEDSIQTGYLREASIIYRIEVWGFTVTEILKNPIYGHGIESQQFMTADTWMVNQNSNTILHAHNLVLQTWIEFGIIGILLGIIYLLYIYHKIYSERSIATRRLYNTVFASFFCCAMTGYGFWQSWQIGTFIFITAITLSFAKYNKEEA